MSMAFLFKLAEHFAAPRVRLDRSRCLNARHPGAHCTRCSQICPTKAITLTEGRPRLDEEQCIRCGACLWECPTNAFEEARPAEAQLATTIAQQSGAVELVCPVAAEQVPHLQDGVTVQAPRCLASLSPAMLIEWAEGTSALWLNDSACAKCRLAPLHASIRRSARRANAWLALYERGGKVRLFSQESPPVVPAAATPKIVDGSKPLVGRRAFLRGKVRRKSVVNLPAVPITAANPVDARLSYALPRERVRLLVLERAWPQPPTCAIAPEEYGLAGIRIEGEHCTLCGWCAGFCPSAALQWVQDGDTLKIVFQPLRCLDCNICQAACPVQAVDKMAQFPAEFLRESLLLAQDVGRACAQCGKLTAARQGALCVWCKQQRSPSADALDLPWEKLFPPPESS